MELKIISSEIIKPSSPTPQHLKIHKLSVLDQVAGDSLFPVIFFYPQTCNNDTTQTSSRLRKSLSEALTQYYPFAGRFKDSFSIQCDDSGAVFIEARVDRNISEILKQPNNDLLEELLPYKLNEKPTVPVNLAAKVTYFDCGGMALCVCFTHVIADITTAGTFVKTWASIARGSNFSNDITDAFFDCSTIFPPQGFSSFSRNAFADNHSQSTELITKRFTFDGVKIANLKEKISKESSSGHYTTRVEAVSAVILGGIMSAEREGDTFHHTNLVPSISVSLRNRTNPPLPEQSIGNIIQAAITTVPIEKTVNYGKLTERLHESITTINDEYLKKFHADGEFMNSLQNALIPLYDPNNRGFTISSWCRRPLYQADFGWGKPMWVSTAMKHKDVAVLLDSNDGKGIEALVALPKKEMTKFGQDPGILAYASVDTSIV